MTHMAEPHEAVQNSTGYDAIEAQLKAFEAEERKRLGLADDIVEHWVDANPAGVQPQASGRTPQSCSAVSRWRTTTS